VCDCVGCLYVHMCVLDVHVCVHVLACMCCVCTCIAVCAHIIVIAQKEAIQPIISVPAKHLSIYSNPISSTWPVALRAAEFQAPINMCCCVCTCVGYLCDVYVCWVGGMCMRVLCM